MIIVMEMGATEEQIQHVVTQVESMGFQAHIVRGEERTIVGVIGNERPASPNGLVLLDGVERVMPVLRPFKLASREFHPQDSVIPVRGVQIGSPRVVIIAGPCAVESRQQLFETAQAVKEAGATILRGGAFKPRTSPYSFQGLGEKGLELLAEARETIDLPIITEVMASEQVELVSRFADILQIGARNMQNYNLLHAVGAAGRPVLLKRGMMATLEELLMSAEYILSHGNYQVVLCERGIRTFETYTRNTLDIIAIPVLKGLTHLPVIVDPSHATGKWGLVQAASKAAVAAGADGLLIEVHPHPDQALSDGAQSLRPEAFAELVRQVRHVAEAVGRTL